MWQIKINDLLIPVYYQYIQQAYMAADEAKKKYIACRIEIVPVQTNQSVNRMWKSSKIIKPINDNFRRTLQGGKVVLTRGIRALPQDDICSIV